MSALYELKGNRGVLSLYFEDNDLAIDVTEYGGVGGYPIEKAVEMFVTCEQVGELADKLHELHYEMRKRKLRRAQDAAERLTAAGVIPADPIGLASLDLKHNADLMERVALHYLNEVVDARSPEAPF